MPAHDGARTWPLAILLAVSVARRTAVVPLLAVLAAAFLSACGSGRYNQNFLEQSTIDATNRNLGTVELRNAFIASPAVAGGDALVSFSLYARADTQGEEITSVQLPGASAGPLQLLELTGGRQSPVPTIPVQRQTSTGQRLFAAKATGLTTALRPATYHDVILTFRNQGPVTISIPVRRIGEVQPGSTVLPSAIPDSPYPAGGGLPGGLASPVATATAQSAP